VLRAGCSAPKRLPLCSTSAQAVQRRRAASSSASPGLNQYSFPAWQFEGQPRLLASGDLDVLGDHDPLWVVFMLNPNDRLDGQRPLDLLHAGRLDEVLTGQCSRSMVPKDAGRPGLHRCHRQTSTSAAYCLSRRQAYGSASIGRHTIQYSSVRVVAVSTLPNTSLGFCTSDAHCAFIETFGQATNNIITELERCSISSISTEHPLVLVDLTGPGLARVIAMLVFWPEST